MYCPKCGEKLSKNAKSCTTCGSQISYPVDNQFEETTRLGINLKVKKNGPNSLNSHMVKGILAISGIIIILVIVSAICMWPRPFNPQEISESGAYNLYQGESIYLESIASTLLFSDAQIDNVDYDTLSLDLVWELQLMPEKSLNANDSDEFDYCIKWISSTYLSGAESIINVLPQPNYLENYISYTLKATIDCKEDPSSLHCAVNNDLKFILQHDFPFSFEAIAMEKVRQDMDKNDYTSASKLLRKIDTPDAQIAIEGIQCIDYATALIDKLNQEYALTSVVAAIDTFFEYDPATYTFFQILKLSEYYDIAYLYAGNDSVVANESALTSIAEDLYFDYFYPKGYTGITCTVIQLNSSDEVLGQFSYSAKSYTTSNGKIDENELNEYAYYRDFEIEGTQLVKYLGSAKNVTVPDGIIIIGEDAFAYNESIESVLLPNTVKEIQMGAFAYCKNLKSINLPNGLETIGLSAIAYGHLQSITIPPSLKTVDSYGLSQDYVKSFTFSDGIEIIPSNVWDGIRLQEVHIPEGVTTIESYAFQSSSITTLYLPSTLTHIEGNAFSNPYNIGKVEFGGTISQWKQIQFDADQYLHESELYNRLTQLEIVCKDGIIPATISNNRDFLIDPFS